MGLTEAAIIQCPACKKDLDATKGKNGKLLLYCWHCNGGGDRIVLAALARSLDGAPLPVRVTRPRKEWTEEQLQTTLNNAQQNLLKDKAAQSFLSDRGISLEFAQSFGLGCGEFYGEQRLVIPYFDGVFSEHVFQLRYRRIKDKESKVGKWACEKRMLGGRRLFNLPLLLNWDPDYSAPLIISESELDCMMLSGLGVNAVSVDTAGHRLVEDDLKLLRQVKQLYLAFDQDDAGWKCTQRFKSHLPNARVLGGYAPDALGTGVKDIGDLSHSMGAAPFAARLNSYLEKRK